MPRTSTIPAATVEEDIWSVEHNIGMNVAVTVGPVGGQVMRADGLIQGGSRGMTYRIAGADYAELISSNPPWAPGKPAGTFRPDDLWHFIDMIRSANN